MPHQSGFGGKILFTTGVSNALSVHPAYTVDADGNIPLVKSIQGGETQGTVQAWTLNQNTDNFEAYAKSDIWVTTFATASEWDADVTVLVPAELTGAAAQASMQPGSVVDITLLMNVNDKFRGKGFISAIDFDDPLDGPVTARIKVIGMSNAAVLVTDPAGALIAGIA